MKKMKWLALCLSVVSAFSFSVFAACSSGGGESMDGSDGDSQSGGGSSSSVHTHSYTYHETELPTKTEDGTWGHYTCDGCDKIFDLSKTETTTDALKITEHLAENSIYAEAAVLNDYDDETISVYNADSGVSVSEVKGSYMIAVDDTGKIVYASNFESGYGGPADDIYHDGLEAPEAGKQFGIFFLYDDFAPWPETTEDGQNAWERYEIDLPAGWHIISGSASSMKEMIFSFTDRDISVVDAGDNKNQLFGKDIGDGFYNDIVKINIVEGAGSAFIDVGETLPEKTEGITYSVSGGAATAFEKKSDGTYVAEVELGTWDTISLVYTDAELNESIIWYDNTSVTGMVSKEEQEGCTWVKDVLYHEGDKKAWYHDNGAPTTYRFIYNPAEKTLMVNALSEGIYYSVSGGATVPFSLGTDGKYEAQVELSAGAKISFTYIDSEKTETTIWYDNTAVSGAVSGEAQEGSQGVDDQLFHEGDKREWCYDTTEGASTTYIFVYDASAKTLEVNVYEGGFSYAIGSNSPTMVEIREDGTYEAVVTLSLWDRITLTYKDPKTQEEITIWYDNTTVTGAVEDEETYGCQWAIDKLYHEKNSDGSVRKAWNNYCKDGAVTTYKIVYNPTAKTLNITVVTEA